MTKYRFKGLSAFEEKDSEYFFQREETVEKLIQTTVNEPITILHSKTGVGKTSLLRAGFVPIIKQNKNCLPIYFSIENYIKDSKNSVINSFIKIIKEYVPKTSFIDKVIEPNESFWYLLKKIESTNDYVFYIILDQFENFFSYPEKEQLEFKNQIYNILYEQIPSDFRNEIDYLLSENPTLLTDKGLKKLFDKLKIKLIISIRSDKLNQLEFFKDKFYNINSNLIELEPITKIDAAAILKKTSTFVPKYNIDNNFESQPFVISSKLLDEIISFLTKQKENEIEAYQIQIIGSELEKISIQNKTRVVDSSLISEISILYKNYYEAIIEQIPNPIQQTSARKFIENELIFEYENRKLTIYEGVAKQKYELNDETIAFLSEKQLINIIKNDKDEKFIELSHDALITPVLLAKEKRIHQEIRIAEELNNKKQIELEAQIEKEKTIRNKKIAITFSILFVFSLVMSVLFFVQKHKALQNQKLALSTLYASYSFRLSETNPTISLRLAEKAYNIDNQNTVAHKAFFNAFYKTNIFYEDILKIKQNFNKAFLSKDGSRVLVLTNSKLLVISNKGEIICEIDKKKDILSLDFSLDNQFVVTSSNDSSIIRYDTLGNKMNLFKTNALTKDISISPDNKYIVAACTDYNLYLFDLESNSNKVFKGHEDEVVFCKFSADGSKIVSTSFDNKVIVWDINGKIINEHKYIFEQGFGTGIIEYAAFAPDSPYVCFAMNDFKNMNYLIKIWDWENNIIINRISVSKNSINSVQFIDNQQILIASDDNNAYICDIFGQNTKKLLGHNNSVFNAVYSEKNQTVYTISADKTVKSWKIFQYNRIFNTLYSPEIITFSNISSDYIIYSNNKILKISSTGSNLFSSEIYAPATNISISENDKYISVSTTSNQLIVFNKSLLKEFEKDFEQNLLSSFVNEKNNCVISINSTSINFFSLKGEKTNSLTTDSIITADVDFDREIIAYVDKSGIKVIDFKGKLIKEIPAENVISLKFFRQDKYLFLTTNDNLLTFDKNYKKISEIKVTNILGSDIIKSGSLICWYDIMGNCHLLNRYGEEVFTFKIKNPIFNLMFSPNEKTVFISSYDIYGKINITEKFVSIVDIIGYINNVKLFGNIYSPTETEFKNLIEN